jgi:hypothetical protein
MKARCFGLAVAMMLTILAVPANASVINWTLSGVTFDDGGTASGTFSTDSNTGGVTAFDITTTGGSTLGGSVYDTTTSALFGNNFFSSNSFILATLNGSSPYINLVFVNPLTSTGVDVLVPGTSVGSVVGSWECNNCDPRRGVVGGEAVSAVPEPSTWAMLLLGFAGIGSMAYRRKSRPALMAA